MGDFQGGPTDRATGREGAEQCPGSRTCTQTPIAQEACRCVPARNCVPARDCAPAHANACQHTPTCRRAEPSRHAWASGAGLQVVRPCTRKPPESPCADQALHRRTARHSANHMRGRIARAHRSAHRLIPDTSLREAHTLARSVPVRGGHRASQTPINQPPLRRQHEQARDNVVHNMHA